MTVPILLVSLLGGALPSQHVIVFAKGDVVAFESPASARIPTDPAQAEFLRRFAADIQKPAPFAPEIPLTEFPVWGRAVPGARGVLRFHDAFKGGFLVQVAIEGLLPKHHYILTLNGNPKREGNNNLVTPVPGNELEKFFDFQTVTTDVDGKYSAWYAIALQKGPYDVRFYVKDTSDFKIVLYHDFFRFKVE